MSQGTSDDVPTTGTPVTRSFGSGVGAGTRLGPYHLLECIGEGGMGEVWLAEQREPIDRRVAIKLIKASAIYGDEHPEVSIALSNLGQVARDSGRLDEAETLFGQAIAMDRKVNGPEHPRVATCLGYLAEVAMRRGDFHEAEGELREALAIQRKAYPPGNVSLANTESRLGSCLTKEKRYAEAEPLLLGSAEALEKGLGAGHSRAQASFQRVAELYEAWGKPAQAAAWKARLAAPASPSATPAAPASATAPMPSAQKS